LITISPLLRSIPLTFPQVNKTSPCFTRSRFALNTFSFNSSSMAVNFTIMNFSKQKHDLRKQLQTPQSRALVKSGTYANPITRIWYKGIQVSQKYPVNQVQIRYQF